MESVGGVVGGWHRSVGSVADGWHQWVLGEMEWLVREGMVGGDFLNFFVLGISRNGVYRLRQKKKKNLAYKSSLRDSIFKWTPYGK